MSVKESINDTVGWFKKMHIMKSLSQPFSLVTLLFFCTSVLSADEALDFVNSKIDYFDSLRKNLSKNDTPQNRAIIRKKAKEAAFNVIHVAQITRLSLGKYYKKTSKKKIKKFQFLFHQIISEKIMRANISEKKNKIKTSEMPIKILSSEKKQDHIFNQEAHVVKTKVKNKKIPYDIDIYLFRKSEKLYLYDIHIDQASVLLDFKNQFARIIKTKGIKHLLKKMRKQVSKFK